MPKSNVTYYAEKNDILKHKILKITFFYQKWSNRHTILNNNYIFLSFYIIIIILFIIRERSQNLEIKKIK